MDLLLVWDVNETKDHVAVVGITHLELGVVLTYTFHC
jgi:hypothetical protein